MAIVICARNLRVEQLNGRVAALAEESQATVLANAWRALVANARHAAHLRHLAAAHAAALLRVQIVAVLRVWSEQASISAG